MEHRTIGSSFQGGSGDANGIGGGVGVVSHVCIITASMRLRMNAMACSSLRPGHPGGDVARGPQTL